MTPAAPCVGRHDLFDSTDPCDHAAARELCEACPVLAACRAQLEDVLARAKFHGQPEGTWAGRLIADVNGRNRKRRIAGHPATELEAAS